MSTLYEHTPHPWHHQRRQQGPVRVADTLPAGSAWARANTRVGLRITLAVGTMGCAYLFAILALVSLPSAITSGNILVIIAWIAQTFLQLVLLPIIIVGQNAQAVAADKRAEATYKDAEAVLHEALEIQAHLARQDELLTQLVQKLTGS